MKWNENKAGNSLMFEDYDFPIAALKNSSEVEFLINNVSYFFVL